MMRSRIILPVFALGLALSAPIAATAQSLTLPSLQFPENSTFCGLLTLCNEAKDAEVTRSVSLVPETSALAKTETIGQQKSDISPKHVEPDKIKY